MLSTAWLKGHVNIFQTTSRGANVAFAITAGHFSHVQRKKEFCEEHKKQWENRAPWLLIVASLPTGGAVEPVPVQRLSPLHPSALPHQVDQRERLLGL